MATKPTINGMPVISRTERDALLGPPKSNQFTSDDRLYRDFAEFSVVYAWNDLDLRAIRDMLGRNGTPKKLEQVLTLPLRSAPWEIRGGGPAIGLVRDNVGPLLDDLIDQCTSAVSYCKAFFETTWTLKDGQAVYTEIGARPAVSCEAAFDADTGKPDGFRQQLSPITSFYDRGDTALGWARIERNRSFIYTYGAHREPLRGSSDLEVALHCWENIQKLRFLWFQYLEQQSLPKTAVYGDDREQARRNAENFSQAKASGVIPLERTATDPQQRAFEIVESSGKGADQFRVAIEYLEGQQTQSVLASFTDLAQHASTGGLGSNALSADQSEFFLASCQAKADEMAAQITDGIFKPLVLFNYGDVEVPTLHIGPIGNRQTDRALGLLTALITAKDSIVPTELVGELLNHVATFLGLETNKVARIVKDWVAEERANKVAGQLIQQAAIAAGQPADPNAPAPVPPPPGPGGLKVPNPDGLRKPPAPPRLANAPTVDQLLELAAAVPEHTGGMTVPHPDAESVEKQRHEIPLGSPKLTPRQQRRAHKQR
jgi:hypothetical protein